MRLTYEVLWHLQSGHLKCSYMSGLRTSPHPNSGILAANLRMFCGRPDICNHVALLCPLSSPSSQPHNTHNKWGILGIAWDGSLPCHVCDVSAEICSVRFEGLRWRCPYPSLLKHACSSVAHLAPPWYCWLEWYY